MTTKQLENISTRLSLSIPTPKSVPSPKKCTPTSAPRPKTFTPTLTAKPKKPCICLN